MRTSELQGPALNWAVTKCLLPEGWNDAEIILGEDTDYTTNWAQGGPIIEREKIAVEFLQWDDIDCALPIWTSYKYATDFDGQGETPLIAAMRCYVASKLGDEIDIPEEVK